MELPNFDSMFCSLSENAIYEFDGPNSYTLPQFSDVVKNEKNLLHQYIYCLAYKIEEEKINTYSGPFTYVPSKKITQNLLNQYQKDKSRYLATGELPSDKKY